MSEGNGNERDARLEALEEEFRRSYRQLLTAQVIHATEIDELRAMEKQNKKAMAELFEHGKQLDQRIAALVSGIGEYIRETQGFIRQSEENNKRIDARLNRLEGL